MPVKINLSTEEQIISTPLPNHGGKYAVIPHGVIIDKVKEELSKYSFEIEKSFYKATVTGNIANGVYHLSYGDDDDIKLMFAWSNSYDKTQKFKCGIGANVVVCGNGMLVGDMGSAARKHMGADAQKDAFEFIENQIREAKNYYDTLVEHKEIMKKIIITRTTQSALLGRLFADEQILTLTQLGVVKRELDKPSHNYNADPNSVWALYNNMTYSLKESHPTTWLDDHSRLHQFFVNEYGLLVVSDSSEDEEQEPVIQESLDFQFENHESEAEFEEKEEEKPVFSGSNTVVFL